MAFNMTPALPSEPMSTVTPGPSSEPMSSVQPSETVTPVKPAESNQKADEAMTILNVRDAGVTELTTRMTTMQQTGKSCEVLLNVLLKISFIERRALNDNMRPHELVRQISEVFHSFKPSGDGSWPLRTMELAEESYCTKSLFEPKTLSINLSYEHNEAYCWLRDHGCIEGHYEAQTVLMVQDERSAK